MSGIVQTGLIRIPCAITSKNFPLFAFLLTENSSGSTSHEKFGVLLVIGFLLSSLRFTSLVLLVESAASQLFTKQSGSSTLNRVLREITRSHRGGGRPKDKLPNTVCVFFALQFSTPTNRNKQNKAVIYSASDWRALRHFRQVDGLGNPNQVHVFIPIPKAGFLLQVSLRNFERLIYTQLL